MKLFIWNSEKPETNGKLCSSKFQVMLNNGNLLKDNSMAYSNIYGYGTSLLIQWLGLHAAIARGER